MIPVPKISIKIFLNLIVTLLLFGEIYAVSRPDIRSDDTKILEESQMDLMLELISIGNSVIASLDSEDQQEMQLQVQRLKKMWPQIVDVTLSLSDDQYLSKTEENLQENLRQTAALLLFMAKGRNCESPDETFYKPANQCLPIGSTTYCPDKMELNDEPENNEGYCDCSPGFRMIYSNLTGECYLQNTKGPCPDGDWFVLGNGDSRNPECDRIPDGCPADGHHIYWNPNPLMAKQCWQLATKGPCHSEEIVIIDEIGLNASCQSKRIQPSLPISPLRKNKKCYAGSYRHQYLDCRQSLV